MKVIKIFKFVSNLEYVHSVLEEQKIEHSIDLENGTISSDEYQESKILKIIDDLNLDEKEVEVDSYILEGSKEWDKNMYNEGYFTGGKNPSFTNDKSNYLMYGFINLVAGIAGLIYLLNGKTFSRIAFWIMVILILAISGSMFYQYYNFKKEQKSK